MWVEGLCPLCCNLVSIIDLWACVRGGNLDVLFVLVSGRDSQVLGRKAGCQHDEGYCY